MTSRLRPYQAAAVERCRSRLKVCRRVLLVAPTGAGKTVIASHVIARAFARGRHVLFFAHRRELIHQTVRKLIDAGIPADGIGVMMANDPLTRSEAPIQIASIDTFRHRERTPADLVIVDEAHRSLANSYLAAIKHYADAGAFVLGMTATPYRADGGGLGDVYGTLEVVASPAQLIAEGFLVEPRVFSAPAGVRADLTGVRTRGGDYAEADLAEAMNDQRLVGGIVDHWQKHAAGVRTVAFAVNVAHSLAITAAFVAAGIPTEHLDGATPTRERDAILARLERGETLIVSNCGVLCEGWDMPCVKAAVLARPTKSTGLYLQQAGRILRPFGDTRAVILDHAGNALVHGLPQDDRDFTLDATQKRSGGGPTKTCPECDTVMPRGAGVCPECGFAFRAAESKKPPVVDGPGHLVEIDAGANQRMRAGWQRLCDEWDARNKERIAAGEKALKPGVVWHQFVARFGCRPPRGFELPKEMASADERRAALAELLEEAQNKGYKRGWALHRFKRRFGYWPGRGKVAA